MGAFTEGRIHVGLCRDCVSSVSKSFGAQAPMNPAEPINRFCPRSGRPVVSDSLAPYRGLVVGFCNPHCRDDFAANVAQRPLDTRYFDALICERELPARATGE
jgi:hypothetical protein